MASADYENALRDLAEKRAALAAAQSDAAAESSKSSDSATPSRTFANVGSPLPGIAPIAMTREISASAPPVGSAPAEHAAPTLAFAASNAVLQSTTGVPLALAATGAAPKGATADVAAKPTMGKGASAPADVISVALPSTAKTPTSPSTEAILHQPDTLAQFSATPPGTPKSLASIPDTKLAPPANASTATESARVAVLRAYSDLRGLIRGALGPDARADAARLDPTYPIAFLPVRIETRIVARPAQLLVRVYPDEIFADGHEPDLTDDEWNAGVLHWTKIRAGAAPIDRWRILVGNFGATRSAWIASRTEPTVGTWPPVFPPRGTVRPASWSRAVEARLLPNRWVFATADSSGLRIRGVSSAVDPHMPLTVSPDEHVPRVRLDGDGPEIAQDLLWTVDFDRAIDAGMAQRISISDVEATEGIERLLVFGVRSLSSAAHSAEELEALFNAHHYTQGVAFVRQGTRTNHTQRFPAEFPPADPQNGRSFNVERCTRREGDGQRLVRALGMNPMVVEHVADACIDEQPVARAMRTALWPATLGYFLNQMLAPLLSRDDVEHVRKFFVDHVTAQGPYPAFRIGRVPYGVLPVTSIENWRPRAGAKGADVAIPALLRRLRSAWLNGVGAVARVGQTSDPDADLANALALDASTREVRVRAAMGPVLLLNALRLFGADTALWFSARHDIMRLVLARLDIRREDIVIAGVHYADSNPLFAPPLVVPATTPPDPGLVNAYVAKIMTASAEALRDGHVDVSPEAAATLLFRLLRHARLTEYARLATERIGGGRATAPEPELLGIPTEDGTTRSLWAVLGDLPPGPTAAIESVIAVDGRTTGGGRIESVDSAMRLLSAASPDAIERATGETLDLCSSRLDAWITAVATERLGRMREAAPRGVHIGAYGWAERIFPWPADRSRASGGFVHAPSIDQAATAAVLRNAHISHTRGARARYGVNLCSRRVRDALAILEAVRQGQALAAVLGALVERRVHDERLDRCLDALRRAYPYELTLLPPPAPGATERVIPRHVVDGLRMSNEELPADLGTGADHDALVAIRRELVEIVEAVSDLLLAESVHQTVRGNLSVAGATLDSLSRDARPPDPELVRSPRTGTTLVHRIVVGFGDDLPPDPWASVPNTPRSLLEPRLDRWVGRLLGPPAATRLVAKYRVVEPDGSTATTRLDFTLADLALRPLDILALVGTSSGGVPPELDALVRRHAAMHAPAGAQPQPFYEADPSWDSRTIRSLAQSVGVARLINRLLAKSRPARAEDFGPPESHGASPAAPTWPAAVSSRLASLRAQLHALWSALVGLIAQGGTPDVEYVRFLFDGLAQFGLFGGAPPQSSSDADGDLAVLRERAPGVRDELRRRLDRFDEATSAGMEARALFGDGFLLLPMVTGESSRDALAASEEAIRGGPPGGATPSAITTWLQQAARVRDGVQAWRRLELALDSHGRPADGFVIAQLPLSRSLPWFALPHSRTPETPTSVVSLALARPDESGGPVRYGLLIDSWTETIPGETQSTGVSFHYESPASEAGQCVLLAVPPVEGARWTLDGIAAVLNEAFDLAQIRAVDSQLVDGFGQMLPAIFLSANADSDAVSTSFAGALQAKEPEGAF